jgi:arylsulfatase A-like enzyme
MAAMLQLAEWFDYMRENDVYDNTRIILVSDHGRDLYQLEDLVLDDGTDASRFYPLLMVKDFESEGFSSSDTFMTNADVPSLATKDLIENPVNPFTGKEINSNEKTAHDQYIIASENFDVTDDNTFESSKWFSVHDNLWDLSNWEIVAEDAKLTKSE